MAGIEAPVRAALEQSGVAFEVLDCDPDLADTAVFCAHYGYAPEESANTILVKSKTGEEQFVVCVLLADFVEEVGGGRSFQRISDHGDLGMGWVVRPIRLLMRSWAVGFR